MRRTLCTSLCCLLLLQAAPRAEAGEGPARAGGPVEGSDRGAREAVEADILYQRGHEDFLAERFAVAEAQFRAALALDPAHRLARSYLVECLVLAGALEEARTVAEAGRTSAPPPALHPEVSPPSAPPPGPVPPSAPPRGPMTEEEAAALRAEAARTQGAARGVTTMTEEEAARRRDEAAATQASAQALHVAQEARAEEERRHGAAERVARDAQAASAEAEARQTRSAEKQERRVRRNPRSLGHAAAGVAFGGAAVAVGGFLEARPHWSVALSGGVGGFVVRQDDRLRGAVAVSLEGQLTPIPFRLTPVLGAGLMGLLGGAAPSADSILGSLPSRGNTRVVPYALVGARYDFRRRLWVAVLVRLAPSPLFGVAPIPGIQLGLRF